MFLGAFQIYNTFILYRFDSKESARDNHKARQTDTRYYPVNELLHYIQEHFQIRACLKHEMAK